MTTTVVPHFTMVLHSLRCHIHSSANTLGDCYVWWRWELGVGHHLNRRQPFRSQQVGGCCGVVLGWELYIGIPGKMFQTFGNAIPNEVRKSISLSVSEPSAWQPTYAKLVVVPHHPGRDIIVRTLKDGYVHNVPLPRVPWAWEQRASPELTAPKDRIQLPGYSLLPAWIPTLPKLGNVLGFSQRLLCPF